MFLSAVKITCLRERVLLTNKPHDSEIKGILVQDRQLRRVNDYVEHDLYYLIYHYYYYHKYYMDFIHFLFSLQTSAASTFSKLCQPLKGQLRRTADKKVSQTVLVKERVVPPLLHDDKLMAASSSSPAPTASWICSRLS